MREAIERVIAELEKEKEECDQKYVTSTGQWNKYWDGAGDYLDKAILKLKEALTTEITNTR
jgi:hypothetical protein